MNNVFTIARSSHRVTSWATNSGPLSLRMLVVNIAKNRLRLNGRCSAKTWSVK